MTLGEIQIFCMTLCQCHFLDFGSNTKMPYLERIDRGWFEGIHGHGIIYGNEKTT